MADNVVDFPTDYVPPDPESSGAPGPAVLDKQVDKPFHTRTTALQNSRLRLYSPREFRESFHHRTWVIDKVIECGAFGQLMLRA